jgi:hypothetical protein
MAMLLRSAGSVISAGTIARVKLYAFVTLTMEATLSGPSAKTDILRMGRCPIGTGRQEAAKAGKMILSAGGVW